MKKKRLLTLVTSLALVGVIGVGATLAYFTDQDNAENTITMGHVDIELDEPIFTTEHPDSTIEDVTPGQLITKDPTITVKEGSADCYLRVSINPVGLDDGQAQELFAGINLDKENWVLGENGYYYYQKPIVDTSSKGDVTVLVFDEVRIPTNWGNEVADKEFKIDVKAEAIQADNFEPERNEAGKIVGWNHMTVESYNN